MASAQFVQPSPVCCARIAQVERRANPAECLLGNGTKVLVSALLASHVSIGDEMSFPVVPTSDTARTEIYICKNARRGPRGDLYHAPIGNVSRPKQDKRGRLFVSAEVVNGSLGVSSISIPCEALRDYFYRHALGQESRVCVSLYKVVGAPASASPAELRVAFRLRDLELQAEHAAHSEHVALERAFNILAQPDLRACYDALLLDPEAPALFPYGGVGSLLVAGERSRDNHTFFAHRIVGFLPELEQRRFRGPLRKCDFYDDRALYRDPRRKLELWIDPAVLHMTWDATWNQWKHLLPTKMEISGTFVSTGRRRPGDGEQELVQWQAAVPSRLYVKLPADVKEQLESARQIYHRFGQFSTALDRIRARIDQQAVEKSELEKICSELRIPGDFDVAQISWRPDYDPFFYTQLSRRARRLYLFRNEYIFELEKTVVVEIPQLGHATYLFSKPRNMEAFLAIYTQTSKDDIRHNRNNVGETLRFIGRVIHGTNARNWIREIKTRLGFETPVYESAESDSASQHGAVKEGNHTHGSPSG